MQDDFNGRNDVFLFDRSAGTNSLISSADPTNPPLTSNWGGQAPSISADGNLVRDVFVWSRLTGVADIYLHDRTTGENVLVSHSAASPTASGGRKALDPRISANGRYVTFLSDSADHVPGVVDGASSRDAFLYDRTTGEIELLSRRDETPSVARGGITADPSADGSRIVLSGGPLVQGDFNGLLDVYLYNNRWPST